MKKGPKPKPFWDRISKLPNGCWVWTGGYHSNGYGVFWDGENQRQMLAHREAFERCNGPVPDDLPLDHLCRNRGCVNPDHLEPVTSRENNARSESPTALNARKTECKRGHPFDAENTLTIPNGRACRRCKLEQRHRSAKMLLEIMEKK